MGADSQYNKTLGKVGQVRRPNGGGYARTNPYTGKPMENTGRKVTPKLQPLKPEKPKGPKPGKPGRGRIGIDDWRKINKPKKGK